MNWDDEQVILNNPLVPRLSLSTFKDFFTNYTLGNYHPLTNLSFALEVKLAGFNPFVIHLNNLILHLINTGLVFWLVRLLTGGAWSALIAALLFGIHPLHVESVAWATQRKDVLYAFFYLAALIAYEKKSMSWVFVLFILSLLSKIQAIALPAMLLAIDLYRQQKITKELILAKVPLFIISVFVGGLGLYGAKLTGAYHVSELFNLGDRVLLAASGYFIYVIKLIMPYQLSCLYPYPDRASFIFISMGIVAVMLMTVGMRILWKSFNKSRMLIFGILFFTLNIFLGLQLVTVGEAYLADRFTYVASIGIFIILGSFVEGVLNDRWPSIIHLKKIICFGFIAYILTLSTVSFFRVQVWHDGGRLWSDVVDQYPTHHDGYFYRADYYRQMGQLDKAFTDYASAIALKPDFTKAYINRGNLYQALGQFDLALADFNEAIALRPQGHAILINRANVLSQMGRFDEAEKEYEKVLAIEPANAQALYNLNVMIGQRDKILKR